MKQKQVEDGPDLCEDPEEPDYTLSLEQFMAQLRKDTLTGMISCSECILAQGISEEVDGICTAIVQSMWEATGFQFTYVQFLLEG